MHKRGQVAIFVIVGIVIVILIGLLFVGRKEYGIGIPSLEFIQSKLEPIRTDLDKCVKQSTDTTVKRFLEQGGDLGPLKYVFYQSRKVKYLCYNIADEEKCLNMIPSLATMVSGLSKQVNADLKNCVNRDLAKSGLGYEVVVKSGPEALVRLEGDVVLVDINYDVTVTKGETSDRIGKVTKEIEVPIAELYNVAFDIVNAQAKEGFFEQLFYMLNKKGQYIIQVDKSPSAGNVGDIIYKVNKKDNKYQFWFAVEGN